jgi:hypothetical protein
MFIIITIIIIIISIALLCYLSFQLYPADLLSGLHIGYSYCLAQVIFDGGWGTAKVRARLVCM